MPENNSQAKWIKSLGYFSVTVSEIAALTGAGVGLGYLAVKKWNAPEWVILITSMAGLMLAMFRLHRMTRRDMEE